ncbi:MAG: LysR family transcriptional regulator [Methylococcales bacterium]|nr:LysR family transcriptional regulator [Methylococcales bacterium]
MDKLTSMGVFVRVARAGSFAGGAKDFGISRAMATKHIMQLEHALGTRLFNRTTRSLSLTEVGVSYLDRCQQVLMDIDEMESEVTHLQTGARGVLKISAPPGIGATHISVAVAEFLKCHAEVKADLILQSNVPDVVDDGIDVAIHLGSLDDTSLVARKVASSPLVLCGSANYFKEHGTPVTPEDLHTHSCLVNWAIEPREQWQFNSAEGSQLIKISGRVQSNVADVIRIAAINDLGLVLLPEYIVGRDIQKGRLQVVLENYTRLPLDVHAVYPHRKYLSAKVRLFVEFLQVWLPRQVGMQGGR